MAKPVMLVPSSEMICPIQTMVKPNIPVRRFEAACPMEVGKEFMKIKG